VRTREQRQAALLQAALEISGELSLPVVLQRIVDLAAQLTGARYGALGVLGPGGQITEFITQGLTAAEREAIGHVPVGRGILGLLIREPHPLRLRDLHDHSQSIGFPPHHPAMSSFLGAPVLARGQVFGNIYLTEKQGANEFTREDEESLVILATQAGVAIANATLYARSHQRERWLDALRAITTDILAGSDADSLLAAIAEHARDLAGADSATILTTSSVPGQLVVATAVGAHADKVRGQSVPAGKSISGEVMESGRPLVNESAATHRAAQLPMGRRAVRPDPLRERIHRDLVVAQGNSPYAPRVGRPRLAGHVRHRGAHDHQRRGPPGRRRGRHRAMTVRIPRKRKARP